jgi:hypothetical protein
MTKQDLNAFLIAINIALANHFFWREDYAWMLSSLAISTMLMFAHYHLNKME